VLASAMVLVSAYFASLASKDVAHVLERLPFWSAITLGGSHANGSIVWTNEHDTAVRAAAEAGKAVMIDFTADWCTGCKELDAHTFPDAGVAAEAERFVAVKLDASEPDDVMNDLFTRYGVLGLPTVVFIDPRGHVLEQPRVTGFTPPDRFLALMRQVR